MATEAITPDVMTPSTMDAPEVTSATETSVETSHTAPETTETPVEQQPQTTEQPVDQDGRRMSPALRKMVADLQAKPETQALAKQLKGIFFSEQAYRAVFPSPKDAQAAKDFFDQVGGQDGLTQIQAELDEWHGVDEQFLAGDPKFVEQMAANEPEAFAKLVPHALEQFQRINPEMYEHVMARVISNTVDQRGGLRDLLASIKANASNPQQIAQILNQAEGWLNYFSDKAAKVPEKKVDPERQRLDQDRAAFEEQKQTAFRKGIQSDILVHTKNEIKRMLSSHLGGKSIADEDFATFHDNVVTKLQSMMTADKAYIAKGSRFLEAGDRDGALKFQKEKLAQLLPDAVSKTYRLFYSIGSGGKAQPKPQSAPNQAQPGKPAPPGWRRVAGPPKVDEVDHQRTTMDMKWAGQAVLRNGQRVYWGDKVPA